jgi:xanthine dehydrogenase accessory factor
MPQTITGAADHRRILDAARRWAGAPMALATVIETWRSAPAPLGTHMLVHADGRFIGSTSAGCVESDVLATAEAIIKGAPFTIRRYGVTSEAVWEAGLPCGGEIAVLIQPVAETGYSPALFETISAAQAAGQSLSIATDFESGKSVAGETGDFVNHYLSPRRLIVVGAVEIAATLTRVAHDAGFTVTLVDPRARFLTTERFPGITLDDRWPDDAIVAAQPDSRTGIVVLSHDPKIDDPALIAALNSPAAYIAALGSNTSHRARLGRLSASGLSPQTLSRIEGPAGIAINAISAPEIALSIIAGLIKALNDGLR